MKQIPLLLLASLLFAGCEKALMPADEKATSVGTFEYLWQRFDEQYSMFDVKDIDWQQVHDTLRPKVFAGMGSDSQLPPPKCSVAPSSVASAQAPAK